MELPFSIKSLTEFMWKKYNTSICFISEEINDKNILGQYQSYGKEKREKKKKIFINLSNINDETVKKFVLLHEIGHFLLEKANFIQKEEYADFLGYYLMKKFILEKNKIITSSFIKELNLMPIFFIEEDIKKELTNIGELFCYSYFKYLRGEKEHL